LVSKFVGYVLQPSVLLLVFLLAALVALWLGRSRLAGWLLAGGVAILVAGGVLPLANWLLLPLEQRFQRPDISTGKIDGIIVLGGAVDPRISKARNVQAFNEAGERMTEALVLARRHPDAKLVFTGGSAAIFYPSAKESDGAKLLFQDFGLGDPARLVLEDRSRNTWENAVFTKALVKPQPGQRWLLVTSASHMPRAIGNFRKAGFDVEPWPVDYRTAGPQDAWRLFDSPSKGLRRLEVAVHEWLGLIANWLTGRSDAILPAPR
jgi:uncharacterized SAM-binding protein YcdF (DUF218 family)